MNRKSNPPQESHVLAVTYESRGRQDCLVRLSNSGEVHMRHLLRIPQANHSQVEQVIERLRSQLNCLRLPSIVRVEQHNSAGPLGYCIYSQPLPQIDTSSTIRLGNQQVADPLRYILRLGRRLQAASQYKLFHQTLSPSTIYHYGEHQFLLFGFGLPALGATRSVFSAPEVAEGARMNERSTIYTLGMMLFAHYGGTFILGGNDLFRTHNRPYLEDKALNMSANVRSLIEHSTQISPADRPVDLTEFCQLTSGLMKRQVALTQRIEAGLSTLSRQVKSAIRPKQPASPPITGPLLRPIQSTD